MLMLQYFTSLICSGFTIYNIKVEDAASVNENGVMPNQRKHDINVSVLLLFKIQVGT